MRFSHSHGGRSAGKWTANGDNDTGSAKNSEAFTWKKVNKKAAEEQRLFGNGAGEETRTLDVHLGKVVLYQLSYTRRAAARTRVSEASVNSYFAPA